MMSNTVVCSPQLTPEQKAQYQVISARLLDSYLRQDKNERIELLASLLLPKHDSPIESDLCTLQELLANPHASTITRTAILECLSGFYGKIKQECRYTQDAFRPS